LISRARDAGFVNLRNVKQSGRRFHDLADLLIVKPGSSK
jgi:hypothetical protein